MSHLHRDAMGRLWCVIDAPQAAGAHMVRWDGRDDAGRALASGAYLYRLQAGGQMLCRRLLLLR